MTEINGTMMQFFQWYTTSDGSHWQDVAAKAKDLAAAGITALWLPPAYKGSGGGFDVGYSVYDLFDLGEFNQKGSVRTKYGTRAEYLAAIQALHAVGIQVYADCVFNHKNGGDVTEEVDGVPVASDNRNWAIGGVERIKVWTAFTFPGRGEQYSSLKWHWWHFDSVNHNAFKPGDSTIYRFKDKHFETEVDYRLGNYDFLMACDLDTSVEPVCDELKYWGEWILQTTGVDGFRLDAVKHIRASFFKEWLDHVRRYAKKELFSVGEYWSSNVADLHWYIDQTQGCMSLFDAPLHYNFSAASKAGGHYDMRKILAGSLVQKFPALAVTIVENHDTQPLQALESVVESWFKPLAYALILLRRDGYPCIFHADYYGAHYTDRGYEIWLDKHQWILDKFLYARKHYAYGPQYDYFNHPDVIGWTRLGSPEHPQAMAVIMSDGPGGSKWMEVGKPHATFVDLTEHIKQPVPVNEYGWGEFPCDGGSVSVWVQQSGEKC
jgi:alpha-amylase